MASVAVDIPRVAGYTSIPEATVNQLLESPTTDLVQQLLKQIIVKAQEFDEAKSSKLKLKVELENAVRTSDAKVKTVKSSLDKAQEETKKLREQLQTSGQLLTYLVKLI
jgi:nucleoprotein TPR